MSVVPQISPISPLWFSFFIDEMTDVLEFSKFHMHAECPEYTLRANPSAGYGKFADHQHAW
jgi:hypothetical protein